MVPSPASPSFPCLLYPQHVGTSTMGLRSPPTITRSGSRPALWAQWTQHTWLQGPAPTPAHVDLADSALATQSRILPTTGLIGHSTRAQMRSPRQRGGRGRLSHSSTDSPREQATGEQRTRVTARRAFLQSAPATHPDSSPTTTPGFGGHLARA